MHPEAVTILGTGVTALAQTAQELWLCSFQKRSFERSLAYFRSALLLHRSHLHFPPSLETGCNVSAGVPSVPSIPFPAGKRC